MPRLLLLQVLCLLLPTGALSQGRSIPYTVNLTDKNGFPANSIYDIVNDSLGFVWFATDNGLYRYDGYSYEQFQNIEGDEYSLPSNEVLSLLCDSKGQLWVGAGNALCKWNPKDHRFTSFALSSDASARFGIIKLVESPSGDIWVCNERTVIEIFNQESKKFLPISAIQNWNGKNGNSLRVKSIFFESDEVVWLGSFDGLIRLQPKINQMELFRNLDNDWDEIGIVNDIVQDPNDSSVLWLGTWGHGLVRFDKKEKLATNFLYEKAESVNLNNIVFDVEVKDNQHLWVAARGLAEFDLSSNHYHLPLFNSDSPRSICNPELRRIYRADNGLIWLGTADGVSILNPSLQSFQFIPLNESNKCNLIISDNKEEAYYGINLYKNRRLTKFDNSFLISRSWSIPLADERESEPIALYQDSRGYIWLGNVKTGIIQFDPVKEKFKSIPVPSLENERPFFAHDFLQLDSNSIWVASERFGVIQLNCQTFLPIVVGENMKYSSCQKIKADASGRIWALSKGVGLMTWRPEDISNVHYISDPEVVDFEISGGNLLRIRRSGSISIGTIRGEQIDEPIDQLKFPVNGLSELSVDQNGNCWILFNKGLIHLDIHTKAWEIYDTNDGLNGNLSLSELYLAPNGNLFLTYSSGVYLLNESHQRTHAVLPPIQLKSVNVLGRNKFFDFNSKIELEYNQNYLSFDFVALEFSKQSSLSYAYFLEGVDHNWVESGTRHYADYSDLKPGEYTFLVKIKSGNGEWTEPKKLVSFIIIPAWWQTMLFKLVCLFVLILVLFYIIRKFLDMRYQRALKNLERAKELEQMRNRISRDIHDEIGSGLTKIALLSSRLEKNDVSERINDSANDLINNLGDIIWAVNPANDSVQNFASYLRAYSGRYFENTSCEIKLEIHIESEELGQKLLNPYLKRNVMMIVKEAYNNILKHSKASSCFTKVEMLNKSIKIHIGDNGIGLDSGAHSTGNGLMNMEKRVSDLNGVISFKSDSEGLVIDIVVPI